MSAALEVSGLRVRRGAREVIRAATVSVPCAALSVILGRNGSGKSTFLRVVAGLLPKEAGNVRALGVEVEPATFARRSRLCGYLAQQTSVVFPFRVEDYVLTGRGGVAGLVPRDIDRERAAVALAQAGIVALRDRPVTELSGGELQLVRIARVLAQDTPLLLLDEPITHLDIAHQIQVLSLLRDLVAAGRTVVTVLHDATLALLFGNEFLYVLDGVVSRADGPAAMRDETLLEAIYGVPLRVIEPAGAAAVVPRLPPARPRPMVAPAPDR